MKGQAVSVINVLSEPTFRLESSTIHGAVTLSGVLAAMAQDEVESFPALRPHQEHAWYAFLVQLACIAVSRAGLSEPPGDEASWTRLLLALTEDDPDPWTLLVADVRKPAFFQNPIPSGQLAELSNRVATPDLLDVLATAKGHDVKRARMGRARPEHWVFALVSLQTTQGFGGAGNYGIARMNSGFGNRAGVSLSTSVRWGRRFGRDIALALEDRPRLIDERGYSDRGVALLWTLPWDGQASLVDTSGCDPFFIEACRRVRLEPNKGAIAARVVSTRAALHRQTGGVGDTGDPWTPLRVDKDGLKALNVSRTGFTTQLTLDLLTAARRPGGQQPYVRPISMSVARDATGGLFFAGAALARGQGKTDGFHERTLPVPPRGTRLLASDDDATTLRKLGEARLALADLMRSKVLYPALKLLLPGKDRDPERWTSAFSARVDREFFGSLWKAVEQEDGRLAWEKALRDWARATLEDAIRTVPLPSADRWRRITSAEGLFRGSLRKHFPDLNLENADAGHDE